LTVACICIQFADDNTRLQHFDLWFRLMYNKTLFMIKLPFPITFLFTEWDASGSFLC